MGKKNTRNRSEENILKSRLPVSEYPRAWAEYNRRWYAMWLGFLALVAYAIIIMFLVTTYFSNASRSEKRNLGLLLIPGIVVCMIPYFRFDSWPCPRCGLSFSDIKRTMPVRPERCHFCGLQRNSVPEESTWKFQNRIFDQILDDISSGDERVGINESQTEMPKKSPLPLDLKNTALPTDVLLLIVLLVAYALAFLGWPVFGGVIALCSLICYMVCLARAKRPSLYYYPDIKHRNFVFVGFLIGLFWGAFLSRYARVFGFIAAISFGAMFYFFACTFLYSRTARIKGTLSDCLIQRDKHPLLFWIVTGIFSLLGILLILSPFWAYALKR
jgi:hypothetical protein